MKAPRVGLFVTCLVDLFRPAVGFAAVKLLEDAGCAVEVPPVQTCCGQPAFNSGDRADTRTIAQGVIRAFEGFDYVVAPSGPCSGMIARHYPALFGDDPEWRHRAEAVSTKTHELVSFLHDVMGVRTVAARFDGTVTYHDGGSGPREPGRRDRLRRLLAGIEGLTLVETREPEAAAGAKRSSGTKHSAGAKPSSAVKRAGRSAAGLEKVRAIRASGAGTLIADDLGYLMNIAGKLAREGVKARHVAEVLAGMGDGPAIGEAGIGRERELRRQ